MHRNLYMVASLLKIYWEKYVIKESKKYSTINISVKEKLALEYLAKRTVKLY